jgi:hypothetical protein
VRGNNRVTLAIFSINNCRRRNGVQLVERLITYENETHTNLNRSHSAELDYDRYIRRYTQLENDGAIRHGTASTAFCIKDDDGHTSFPPFP